MKLNPVSTMIILIMVFGSVFSCSSSTEEGEDSLYESCFSDDNCGDGQHCMDNSYCSKACNSSDDCGKNGECYDGYMGAGPECCLKCHDDSECPAGTVCLSGDEGTICGNP